MKGILGSYGLCCTWMITQSMQCANPISLNQLWFLSHTVDDCTGSKVDPKKTAVVKAWGLPQDV